MRHRSRPGAQPRGAAGRTAATRSPARRFSSPPASTISRRTSSISCSPASKARRAGVKGISLFVVPKFLSSRDGAVGARNGVSCGSIEEKMGIHGNSTCVMNYDDATGWLVGEANRGLNAMFVMMNEARLGVGVQGLALSEVAYQNAASYAKERLAGRALTGAKFKDKPADPIIVHPDVRRMLMTMRAFNEGGARAGAVDRAQERRRASLRRCQGAAGRRRPYGPDDAGDQRRAHRPGFRQHRAGAAGVRRPRLHRRARHGAVRARCAHRHDLRGRQRHPGARPRRPQAAEGRRPRACRRSSPRSTASSRSTAATRRSRPTSSRSRRRSASCSRRRCGSCRMRSPIPKMPAPARPITCTSSGWSRSATCGA